MWRDVCGDALGGPGDLADQRRRGCSRIAVVGVDGARAGARGCRWWRGRCRRSRPRPGLSIAGDVGGHGAGQIAAGDRVERALRARWRRAPRAGRGGRAPRAAERRMPRLTMRTIADRRAAWPAGRRSGRRVRAAAAAASARGDVGRPGAARRRRRSSPAPPAGCARTCRPSPARRAPRRCRRVPSPGTASLLTDVVVLVIGRGGARGDASAIAGRAAPRRRHRPSRCIDAGLPLALVARRRPSPRRAPGRPAAGACPRPGWRHPSTAPLPGDRALVGACWPRDDLTRTTSERREHDGEDAGEGEAELDAERAAEGCAHGCSLIGHPRLKVEQRRISSAIADAAAIMGRREARRALDPPRRRVRGDALHSGPDRDGLRGRRAAPPARGRVDRLRPRRRPRRRVRRAGLRQLVPTRAEDRRADRRRAADGAARRRLRAPDRPRLRDRRRAGGAGADARAARARVRARRGAGAADGAGAVGDRPAPALVGLSPPALAASTTITPGVPAAVLLAGAALCALAVRERPRLRYVFGGALLLAGLPWLGWTFVAPGVVVAWALVHLDAARAAAARRARGGRGAGRLAGLLRDDQRSLLRRTDAARRRG